MKEKFFKWFAISIIVALFLTIVITSVIIAAKKDGIQNIPNAACCLYQLEE